VSDTEGATAEFSSNRAFSRCPVGYLADILVHFESNPFPVKLSPAEPYLNYLSCLAEYAPDIPASLKKAIVSPRKWDRLAKKLAKESLLAKAFMGTTQVRHGLEMMRFFVCGTHS
jgi:hypothetical protein